MVPAAEAERPMSASKKSQTPSRHQPILHQLPAIAILDICDHKNDKFVLHTPANRGGESAPPLDQETKWLMSWVTTPPGLGGGWLFDKGNADGWPNHRPCCITAAVVGPEPL